MKKALIPFLTVVTIFFFASFDAKCQEKKEFTSGDFKYEGKDYPDIKIDFNSAQVFVLNGKVVKNNPLNNLKKEEVESYVFYSGDEAVKKYGEKARPGVLEILTKDI